MRRKAAAVHTFWAVVYAVEMEPALSGLAKRSRLPSTHEIPTTLDITRKFPIHGEIIFFEHLAKRVVRMDATSEKSHVFVV